METGAIRFCTEDAQRLGKVVLIQLELVAPNEILAEEILEDDVR
jgi:hypothetical protein